MGEITEKPDLEHDDMEPVRASEFANTTTDGANARSLTSQSRRADTPLTVESQSARLEGTSVIHSRGTSECAENLQHAHAKIIPEDKLPSHAPKALNGPRADFSPPASASDVSLSDSIGSHAIYETGDDELDTLLQELQETLVQEMIHDYKMTAGCAGQKSCLQPSSGSSSSSQAESRQESSTLPADSRGAKGRGKRPRDEEYDEENLSDDDEAPDRRRPKRRETAAPTSDIVPEKLFACPYSKHEPSRYSERNMAEKNYRGCSSSYLKDVPRLKQHLYRKHGRPDHYCGRCFQDFKTRELLDAHSQQSPSCIVSDCPFPEKMSVDQRLQIKRRSYAKDACEIWFSIWGILFPGVDPPESPFAEMRSSAVQGLFERFRTHARPILSRLLRGHTSVSAPMDHYEEQVLDNAVEEALSEIILQFGPELETAELSSFQGRDVGPQDSQPVPDASSPDYLAGVDLTQDSIMYSNSTKQVRGQEAPTPSVLVPDRPIQNAYASIANSWASSGIAPTPKADMLSGTSLYSASQFDYCEIADQSWNLDLLAPNFHSSLPGALNNS
jgi:hypothetical protein